MLVYLCSPTGEEDSFLKLGLGASFKKVKSR